MECERVTLPDYNFPQSQTEKRQWQQWSLKTNLRNHTFLMMSKGFDHIFNVIKIPG